MQHAVSPTGAVTVRGRVNIAHPPTLSIKVDALGAAFSVGDLLGSGTATAQGPNIVAKARADMAKIRDRVAGLVALKRDGGLTGPALTEQLLLQWIAADGVINGVFGGSGEGRLERTTSESRVLDAFDRLVDALSSVCCMPH